MSAPATPFWELRRVLARAPGGRRLLLDRVDSWCRRAASTC